MSGFDSVSSSRSQFSSTLITMRQFICYFSNLIAVAEQLNQPVQSTTGVLECPLT